MAKTNELYYVRNFMRVSKSNFNTNSRIYKRHMNTTFYQYVYSSVVQVVMASSVVSLDILIDAVGWKKSKAANKFLLNFTEF